MAGQKPRPGRTSNVSGLANGRAHMPYFFLFLVLGLVIGGLTAWIFLADHPFESSETPGGPVDEVEASLLVTEMAADGLPIDEATVVKLLKLHGAYVDGKIRAAQTDAETKRMDAERTGAIAETAREDAG
jgi:hypothetical protein